MKKIIPGNPIFLFISVFVPWYLMNTYVVLDDDRIVFSRYHRDNQKTKKKKTLTEVNIPDLLEIGFPEDLGIERSEKAQQSRFGRYLSQEIDFKTRLNIVTINARPYSKKQIRYLAKYVKSINGKVIIGKALSHLI